MDKFLEALKGINVQITSVDFVSIMKWKAFSEVGYALVTGFFIIMFVLVVGFTIRLIMKLYYKLEKDNSK